jgi:hypothetical protein
MIARIRRASALITLLAVSIAPLLPPEHIHRGVVRGQVHLLVHRHFAPHTSPPELTWNVLEWRMVRRRGSTTRLLRYRIGCCWDRTQVPSSFAY